MPAGPGSCAPASHHQVAQVGSCCRHHAPVRLPQLVPPVLAARGGACSSECGRAAGGGGGQQQPRRRRDAASSNATAMQPACSRHAASRMQSCWAPCWLTPPTVPQCSPAHATHRAPVQPRAHHPPRPSAVPRTPPTVPQSRLGQIRPPVQEPADHGVKHGVVHTQLGGGGAWQQATAGGMGQRCRGQQITAPCTPAPGGGGAWQQATAGGAREPTCRHRPQLRPQPAPGHPPAATACTYAIRALVTTPLPRPSCLLMWSTSSMKCWRAVMRSFCAFAARCLSESIAAAVRRGRRGAWQWVPRAPGACPAPLPSLGGAQHTASHLPETAPPGHPWRRQSPRTPRPAPAPCRRPPR